MHIRSLLRSVIIFALSLSLGPFALPQDNNSAPDQTKTASAEPAKPAAADLKASSAEEGKLATVNNAKIPSYAKVYVAPMLGGFENYIIAGLRNKKVPLIVVVDRTKAEYEPERSFLAIRSTRLTLCAAGRAQAKRAPNISSKSCLIS